MMGGLYEEKKSRELEEFPFKFQILPRKKELNIWIHIILFGTTVITTTFVGALYENARPFEHIGELAKGLPFSLSLLVILLSHEMGHFLASKKHNVKATLPYFIPAPIGVGTFGAFIRIKEPIKDRRSLLDIGVAGPIAGAILSIIAVAWGLKHSQVTFKPLPQGTMILGEPLLFKLISRIIIGDLPENADVILHPVAFAGWIGFFVTALNLIPIGQLDGGHIVFALFGPWHVIISRAVFLALVVIGIWGGLPYSSWILYGFGALITIYAILSVGRSTPSRKIGFLILIVMWISALAEQSYDPGTSVWLFWGVLTNFLGFDHPAVYDLYEPLDWKRKILGFCAIALFVLTFVPKPFKIIY